MTLAERIEHAYAAWLQAMRLRVTLWKLGAISRDSWPESGE
jgi:hypothetical protein